MPRKKIHEIKVRYRKRDEFIFEEIRKNVKTLNAMGHKATFESEVIRLLRFALLGDGPDLRKRAEKIGLEPDASNDN